MQTINYTGKQYTVTIPIDAIERMEWEKGTKVYIGKDPDRNILFIEKIPKRKQVKK